MNSISPTLQLYYQSIARYFKFKYISSISPKKKYFQSFERNVETQTKEIKKDKGKDKKINLIRTWKTANIAWTSQWDQ